MQPHTEAVEPENNEDSEDPHIRNSEWRGQLGAL